MSKFPVVSLVCQEANKKCEIIRDLYINCWDAKAGGPAHGGTGLMGGWYDGCSGKIWYHKEQTYKYA